MGFVLPGRGREGAPVTPGWTSPVAQGFEGPRPPDVSADRPDRPFGAPARNRAGERRRREFFLFLSS
jgi:hypothetical protein